MKLRKIEKIYKQIQINKIKEYKNIKNESAITIISLVVTVIVLIILAGITISTIGGENGLIEQAKKQRSSVETKKNITDSKIANMENYLSDGNTVGEKIPSLTVGNTILSLSPYTWTNEDVTISISTNTKGYSLQYQINSTTGSWINYTNSFIATENEIIYTRLWNGTDAGDYATLEISNIDKAKPNINSLTSTITSSSITTNASVLDNLSGISQIIWYYKLSSDSSYASSTDIYTEMKGAKTGDISTVKTHLFSGLVTGSTYNIYADVYDVAGNVSTSDIINVSILTISDAFQQNKIKVGDYVSYSPTPGSATYSNVFGQQVNGYREGTSGAEDTGIMDFCYRIYDKTEDGKVRIVADYNPSNINGLYSSQYANCCYDNAVYYMNKLCSDLYSNTSLGTAKNMSIEDVIKHINYDYTTYQNGIYSYGQEVNLFRTTGELKNRIIAKVASIGEIKLGILDPEQSLTNNLIYTKEKIYGGTLEQSQENEPFQTINYTVAMSSLKQTSWEKDLLKTDYTDEGYYNIFQYGTYLASRCYKIPSSRAVFSEGLFKISNNSVKYAPSFEGTIIAKSKTDTVRDATYDIWPIVTLNENVVIDTYIGNGETADQSYQLRN